MASFTEITENKRKRRHKNAGRARKRKLSRKSTASYDELFAACGAPGEPAPAQGAVAAKSAAPAE